MPDNHPRSLPERAPIASLGRNPRRQIYAALSYGALPVLGEGGGGCSCKIRLFLLPFMSTDLPPQTLILLFESEVLFMPAAISRRRTAVDKVSNHPRFGSHSAFSCSSVIHSASATHADFRGTRP